MFDKKNRQIFTYHNGTSLVVGDPLELDRRMNVFLPAAANEVLQNWQLATNPANPKPDKMPTPEAIFEAQNLLVKAIREAFRMTPFDAQTGMGAWEEDCLNAWDKFVDFMEEKKNGDVSSPTLPNSGDGPQPSPYPESTWTEPLPDMDSTSPSC